MMRETMVHSFDKRHVLSLMTVKNAPVQHQKVQTRVIAIASGKGGVGKTWISLSLTHELARSGKRVLIIDGDFSLANVDLQLGLTPRYDLVDLLSGRCVMEEAIHTYRSKQGSLQFDVLPGRSGLSSGASPGRESVDKLILSLRLLQKYDYIVIDLCAGIDTVTRHLSASADRLLAVTTEEPTALADIYAVMKLYARDRRSSGGLVSDCRVVINQSASHRSGRQTFEKLFQACHAFLKWNPELAGCIRKDSRVPSSIRQQRSLVEAHRMSPAAVDIGRLAQALIRELSTVTSQSVGRDLRGG